MLKRIFWLILLSALTFLLLGLMVSSAQETLPPPVYALQPVPALPDDQDIKISQPEKAEAIQFGPDLPLTVLKQRRETSCAEQRTPHQDWRFYAFHLSDEAG